MAHNDQSSKAAVWNWKSAFFSSICRGAVFFFANLSHGFAAAQGAMLAEFAYRAVTAGFYGALTQACRKSAPRGRPVILLIIGLPLGQHALEFAIHWMRHTPALKASIISSVVFTVISTLFNLHAMRKGVLVAGGEGRPIAEDLRAIPGTIISFFASGFGLLRIAEGRKPAFGTPTP
jgi:hypothetical protein